MNIDVLEEVVFVYLFVRLPVLLLFSIATLGIQVLRSKLYGYRFYRPFLVNIVLAWIPMALSVLAYIVFLRNDLNVTWTSLLLLGVWFFFFPNAIYLITEVHHFQIESDVPLWFDTIGILSIVTNGVMLGTYSLAIIHFFLRSQFTGGVSWAIIIGYVLLANVGVYIGRYLRFNSWDILKPHRLIAGIFREFRNRAQLRDLALYAILFSFFILTAYVFVYLTLENYYGLAISIEKLQESLK